MFSLASCPTLLARVITVSIMLDQFSLPDRDHSQTECNSVQYSTECPRVNRVENLRPAMGRGIDSRNRVWNWVAKLHRLAGRFDNPMPTWFLAPIAGLKLPTQLWALGNGKQRVRPGSWHYIIEGWPYMASCLAWLGESGPAGVICSVMDGAYHRLYISIYIGVEMK